MEWNRKRQAAKHAKRRILSEEGRKAGKELNVPLASGAPVAAASRLQSITSLRSLRSLAANLIRVSGKAHGHHRPFALGVPRSRGLPVHDRPMHSHSVPHQLLPCLLQPGRPHLPTAGTAVFLVPWRSCPLASENPRNRARFMLQQQRAAPQFFQHFRFSAFQRLPLDRRTRRPNHIDKSSIYEPRPSRKLPGYHVRTCYE